MRVTVCRPDEIGPAEIRAWQQMQRDTPSLGSPFLSAEFARAAGRFRPAVRVAVLADGPQIAGFFPFEQRRLGAGAPLCGLPGTFVQGLVHVPGADWNAQDLLRGCGLSAWQFDHLLASQHPFANYQAATAPSAVMDLSDGYPAFHERLRTKAPRFVKDLARNMRRLERDVGPLRLETGSTDPAQLRVMMGWKGEQYRQNGWVFDYGRPWASGLLEELLAARGERLAGLIGITYAGDQPVAGQFGLRSGNLVDGWFIAYDQRFARYSPGLIHILQMAEAIAGTGVHYVEMGDGAAGFKEKLRSHDTVVARGMVTSGSMLAAAHRAGGAVRRRASQTVYQHPRLYRATLRARSAFR
ncbi:MAG TPA: GNAT family N-acetyltransferase [Streptosporangiaceae bacterium]|nr:GNAT family N-acetyltransferase [Streptosporangiaceae bacterium]